MFKVECPGCKAPYQVDERRIPSSGLKMRCPKCGTSFKVDSPSDPRRTGTSPVLGGVLGMTETDSVAPPAAAPADPLKGTMVGVAPPRAAAMKGTMMGVAPAGAARPPVPPRPLAPPRPAAAPEPTAASAAPHDLPALAARPALGDVALPSLGARPAPPAEPHLDLDLPELTGSRGVELPSLRVPASTAATKLAAPAPRSGLELDLPAVSDERGAGLPATAPQRGGIDLPSVSASHSGLPAVVLPNVGAGLPARAGGSGPSGMGLPATRSASVELPSLGGAHLPSVGGGLPGRRADANQWADGGADLPLVGAGLPASADVALPSLSGELPAVGAHLPALGGSLPARGGDLPSVGSGELPAVGGHLPAPGGKWGSMDSLPLVAGSLPVPASPSLPPALGGSFPGARPSGAMRAPSLGPAAPVAAGVFGEIELPPSESMPPPAQASGAFGELDLLGGSPPSLAGSAVSMESLEADPFGEMPLSGPSSQRFAPPEVSAPDAFAAADATLQRQTGGGGTDYGEVSLDGGPGGGAAEVALDAAPAPPARNEDDMEFGAVPQENQARPAAGGALHVAMPAAKLGDHGRRRVGVKLLAAGFVLGLGGASLALLPEVGPFGAYFAMDRLNAGDYRELLRSTAKAANQALARDTYLDAAQAAQTVARAQGSARRAKALAALAAYVGFSSELRFGADAAVHARAAVLLDELAEETDVDMLELARAARAAADGQIAKARQLLNSAERHGKSVETALLRSEIELRAKEASAAVGAWESAKRYGSTPRVLFGLARAKQAAGDDKGALAEAEAVMAKNAEHVGARILVARLLSGARESEGRAVALIEAVLKEPRRASPDELVTAYTLLGHVHLGRSRMSAAEAAFSEALKINPKAARALVGLGDALYRAGRYSEAQARFAAGTQADPDELLAKVGVAKSKLALERVQEAGALLTKLREAQPKSPLVGYWYGRVQEALGAREQAAAVYREVLRNAPTDPGSADVYIALALLQNQQGRADDAQKTLASAKALMPTVPAVWSALGDVALSQGLYKEALSDFLRASSLDPDDLGARFRIGSAYRRDAQFEQASKIFDEVGAIDREYPGLALERGLLFEASGRSEEALKQYEDALAKAPTDPDLMLRVGCGKVSANRAVQAEELLRKVLGQRPSSAETHHCLGRSLLAQGTRLADALRTLERAVELDPNRAEYFLHVGWAANEAGNVPKAEKALAEALRLDQGLADAYWQRGVLRQRQGAVRDAIADLTRALVLRPSRYEAHAALADAFYDLGREGEAMREWQLAIQAQQDNATWRFRYGKLLGANHQSEAAVEQLTKALALTQASETPPRWRWEAHHALARALGGSPDAAQHWTEFLRLGPRDSPYRPEAKAMLEKLGKPFVGD